MLAVFLSQLFGDKGVESFNEANEKPPLYDGFYDFEFKPKGHRGQAPCWRGVSLEP